MRKTEVNGRSREELPEYLYEHMGSEESPASGATDAAVMPTVDALGTYGPDGGDLWPLSQPASGLWVALGVPAGL
jgi:hypothetical protein